MVATALVAAPIATAPAADARAIAGQAGATAAAANSPDRARRGGWGVFGSADIFQRDADLGCDPGQEEDAGLCYKACKPGFQGVGPVCWAACRPGYTNHGALCNKDTGFTKSSYGNGWGAVMKPQGCRAGYTNTGLLCTRCTGGWPWEWRCSTYAQKLACDAGLEQDGALCYTPCKAGYYSVGPVCWQRCPSTHTDIGTVCTDLHVYAKDTYPRGVGVPMRERYGPIKPITHQSANSGAASIFQKITEGTCESSGLAPIDDDALCTKAAAALGHAITWGPHGGYPDVPRGCTVRAQTQLFRNPAAFSTQGAPCSTRNACVCQPPDFAAVTEGTCESAGLAPIDDDALCTKAAAALGHAITWGPHGGYPDVPRGCTVRAQTQLFRNPAASSTQGAPCSTRNTCVCRRGKDAGETQEIKNRHGICLDASQHSSNGGKVHMWACNTGNANQQWNYNPTTGQIKNRHGICLDASQRSSNGGKVIMWACNTGNANQQWSLSLHTTSADGTNVQSVKDLDDAFTIVFIADLEDNFRGHTSHNSRRIVQSIADLKRLRNIKFDAHPNPELVIHGGDISKDSWKCSEGLDCHLRTKEEMIDYQLDKVWGPLEEQRIPMVSALGNHDWATLKRVEGGDWLGDSKEKHIANLVSVEFARRTYKNAAKMTDKLSYKEYAPQKKFGQVFINAEFKGVQIANFMENFDTKSYEFDNNKDCTAAGSDYGLGGCTTESTGSQYDDIVRDLDRNKVTLAVVHKPISISSCPAALGGSKPSEFKPALVDKFVGMLSEFPRGAAVLSGHTHCFKETPHVAPNGREIVDYTAPCPWTHKGDADGKGGYIAMLVSPTRGILETKRINSGL